MPTYEVTINGRTARVTAASPQEAAEAAELAAAGGKRPPAQPVKRGQSLNPVTAWRETVGGAWDEFKDAVGDDYRETTKARVPRNPREFVDSVVGDHKRKGRVAGAGLNLVASPLTGILEGVAVRPYGAVMGAITDRPAEEWQGDMRLALTALGPGKSGGPRVGGMSARPQPMGPHKPLLPGGPRPPRPGEDLTAHVYGPPAAASALPPPPKPRANVPAKVAPEQLPRRQVKRARRMVETLAPELLELPAQSGRVALPDLQLPFEVSEGARELARAAYGSGGPAQRIGKASLDARNAGGRDRLSRIVTRHLGSDGSDFHDLAEAVQKIRREEADPLYAEARERPIELTPQLRDHLRRPIVARAQQEAEELALNHGRDPRRLGLTFGENPRDWEVAGPPVAGPGRVASLPGPQPIRGGTSLWDRVSRLGGVADYDDALRGAGVDVLSAKHAARRGRVRPGVAMEELAQQLWSERYFPDHDVPPTPEEVVQALAEGRAGRHRYPGNPGLQQIGRGAAVADEDIPPALSPEDYVGRPEPQVEFQDEFVPTTEAWDLILRKLDDVIKPYRDAANPRVKDETYYAAVENYKGIQQLLHEQNPAYQQAQAIWRGRSQEEDALGFGRSLMRRQIDPEEVRAVVGDLSETGRDLAQVGLARAIHDEILSYDAVQLARRMGLNEVLQERMRPVFRSDDDFSQMLEGVQREVDMRASSSDIHAGSRTTPLREAIDKVNEAGRSTPVAAGAARVLSRWANGQGPIRQLVGGAGKALEERLTELPALQDPVVSRLLGEILFAGKPAREVLAIASRDPNVRPEQLQLLVEALEALAGRAAPAAVAAAGAQQLAGER